MRLKSCFALLRWPHEAREEDACWTSDLTDHPGLQVSALAGDCGRLNLDAETHYGRYDSKSRHIQHVDIVFLDEYLKALRR
jgi:hypothetical protein